MGKFFQNAINAVAPRYQTDEEREAEELRNQSDAIWNETLDSAPSAMDLAGYGLYSGQVPQEYIDQYIAENMPVRETRTPDGSRHAAGGSGGPSATAEWGPWMGSPSVNEWGGTGDTVETRSGHRRPAGGSPNSFASRLDASRREDLAQQAQEQWLQEQLAKDPLFGLGLSDSPEMGNAAADADSIAAQRLALQQMGGIYQAGGYTDSERAQLQMSQRDAAMGERSQRMAVQQQAAARGMGGGGMEMMGALAAQQGGANRANDWANQIAVAAQQRALTALQNYGQQAGQMRGQSFQEDSARRAARDNWMRLNAGTIQDRQSQMGMAQQNVYSNRVTGAAGATGQLNGSAALQQQQSDEEADAARQVITSAATALGYAYGGPPAGAAAGATASKVF